MNIFVREKLTLHYREERIIIFEYYSAILKEEVDFMKKFFKNFFTAALHMIIAMAITFIGFVAGEICDDLITGWSMKEPVLAYIAAAGIVIYWCKKATKKLEA